MANELFMTEYNIKIFNFMFLAIWHMETHPARTHIRWTRNCDLTTDIVLHCGSCNQQAGNTVNLQCAGPSGTK